MKHFKQFFFYLFSITVIISCSSDNSDDDTEIVNPLAAYEELNIAYGSDSDQVFDLYLPANRTTATKTLILVHGGGWSSGDKAEMNPFKEFIKEQMPSYAVANINYSLADENNQAYPMQINDIKIDNRGIVNWPRGWFCWRECWGTFILIMELCF